MDPGEARIVAFGEIWTGLLQHSGVIGAAGAREILDLNACGDVRTWERPMLRAASPGIVTGVDCRLPGPAGGRSPRAVGSVISHAQLTGGRILQGSALARPVGAIQGRRRPWSHHLSRPGTVEVAGPFPRPGLPEAFLDAADGGPWLDLGAVARRRAAEVQRSSLLDHRPPLTAMRTSLRWVVTTLPDAHDDPVEARFAVDGACRRTLHLTLPAGWLAADGPAGHDGSLEAARLCADLARHDWLLTLVGSILARGHARDRDRARLRAAAEHLLLLWLPGAGISPRGRGLLEAILREPGLERQWANMAGQVMRVLALPAFGRAGD